LRRLLFLSLLIASILGASIHLPETAAQPEALDHLAIDTIPSPRIAGEPFQLTVTARYANDSIYSLTGPVTLSDSSGTIEPTIVTLTNGKWSGSVTVTLAQKNAYINAIGFGKTITSNLFDIIPNKHVQFYMSISTRTPLVGQPVDLVIVAKDAYNNTFKNYTGTVVLGISTKNRVDFSSTIHDFTFADSGTLRLRNTVAFYVAEPTSLVLTARDTKDPSIQGYIRDIMVQPRSPSKIVKVAGDDQTGVVGRTLPEFEVQLLDEFNNSIPNVNLEWVLVAPSGSSGQALLHNKTRTDLLGKSANTLTLGNKIGVYYVGAIVASSRKLAVQFVAHAISQEDFALSLSGYSGSIYHGLQDSTWVFVDSLGSYNVPVGLSYSSLPPGVTINFTVPASKPPYKSMMKIVVSDSAPVGTYQITIKAMSLDGRGEKSTTYALTVNQPPYLLIILAITVSFFLGLFVSEALRTQPPKVESLSKIGVNVAQGVITSALSFYTQTGTVSPLLAAEIFLGQFLSFLLASLAHKYSSSVAKALTKLRSLIP